MRAERLATGDTMERAQGAPAIARTVVAIAAAGAAARLALAAIIPITVDEAYYVDWARHLEAGYLDHPPLVAWLLAVPLRLLGPTTVAVRLPAVLLQAGTTFLGASLARARAGDRAAVTVALVLQAAPVFSLGATLMTPDAPLAFAWVGALWSLERAFRCGPRWFLACGAFLGMAALSKLTAGLLGVAVFGALLATQDGRRALAGPWPWLAALLALAVASPMLAWNASRGWPSFAFQLAHGARGRIFSAADLARSVGAQAAYVSPLVLGLALVAAGRALGAMREPVTAALALSALPVVAFFTFAAAFTRGALPHWPAPGWLSACLLLGIAGGRLVRAALAVGFVASAAVILALLAQLSVVREALDELSGWREGAMAARAAAGTARLATTHWIVLGELGWYDGASPAYLGARASGPTFYDPAPLARREPLLVVTVEGLDPGRDALEARLGPLVPAGDFTSTEGSRVVRRFRFWRWEPPHDR